MTQIRWYHVLLIALTLFLQCSMATTSTASPSRGFGFFQSSSSKSSSSTTSPSNSNNKNQNSRHEKVSSLTSPKHKRRLNKYPPSHSISRRRNTNDYDTPTRSPHVSGHHHPRDFSTTALNNDDNNNNNNKEEDDIDLYDREPLGSSSSSSDRDETIMNEVLSEYDLLSAIQDDEELSSQSKPKRQHQQYQDSDEEQYYSSPPPSSSFHPQQHNLLQVPCAIRIAPEDNSGLEQHQQLNRITSVSAFVDTGAQVTVMSKAACVKAGLLHLIDRRYAGHATGVGHVRVLGRIPANTLQLSMGNGASSSTIPPFRGPAITVLESTGTDGVDVLIGLDFLRDHQAILSLQKDEMILMVPSSPSTSTALSHKKKNDNLMPVVIPFIKPRKEVKNCPPLLDQENSNNNKDTTNEKKTQTSKSSTFDDYFEDDEDSDDEDGNTHAVDMSGF